MERKGVKLPQYSVLMSVYSGEKPEYFKACIESMLRQTFVTDDFVLVCDGPLTDELDEIVSDYECRYSFFRPLRMPDFSLSAAHGASVAQKSSELPELTSSPSPLTISRASY